MNTTQASNDPGNDGIQKDGYGLPIEGEKVDSVPVKKDEHGNVIEETNMKALLDEKQKSILDEKQKSQGIRKPPNEPRSCSRCG